jgi:hypothetical protein
VAQTLYRFFKPVSPPVCVDDDGNEGNIFILIHFYFSSGSSVTAL